MKVLTKVEDREKYSVLHTTIAGVAVAFAQSVIICPLELIKSRLQIQTDSKHRLYKGGFVFNAPFRSYRIFTGNTRQLKAAEMIHFLIGPRFQHRHLIGPIKTSSVTQGGLMTLVLK